jgi:hypothetical protein
VTQSIPALEMGSPEPLTDSSGGHAKRGGYFKLAPAGIPQLKGFVPTRLAPVLEMIWPYHSIRRLAIRRLAIWTFGFFDCWPGFGQRWIIIDRYRPLSQNYIEGVKGAQISRAPFSRQDRYAPFLARRKLQYVATSVPSVEIEMERGLRSIRYRSHPGIRILVIQSRSHGASRDSA